MQPANISSKAKHYPPRIEHGLVVVEGQHVWWRCPNCRFRLAELIGKRAVIKAGSITVSVAIQAEPDQTCPKCGATSAIGESVTN